jgi:hypothetical protein
VILPNGKIRLFFSSGTRMALRPRKLLSSPYICREDCFTWTKKDSFKQGKIASKTHWTFLKASVNKTDLRSEFRISDAGMHSAIDMGSSRFTNITWPLHQGLALV